jgi:hypothetical protein
MSTIVKLRADLALDKESIPVINHDDMYLDEEAIDECTFLHQCDVTGQVALVDRDGMLIVLYGIDLDFEEGDI